MFFETGALAGWTLPPMFLMPFGLKCKKKKVGIGGGGGDGFEYPAYTLFIVFSIVNTEQKKKIHALPSPDLLRRITFPEREDMMAGMG